jgi:hypothetical protein
LSRVDLHPEELLDRARSGTASNEELARARAHMACCAACTIEQTLLIEIERSAAPQPHDHLIAGRLRTFVAGKLEERRQPGTAATKRRRARKWATFAFAATLLLTTLGAAMVMLRERRRPLAELAASAPIAATSPPASLVPNETPSIAASPGSDEAKDRLEKASDRSGDEAPAARTGPRSPRIAAKTERIQAKHGSAAELFARANLLRRRDEVREAAGVYRELQQSFRGSAEELLSRVVLGRLLLDRLGDPSAALTQFESYLASPSQGSLREEALVGRAVALGRLGRAAEERSAWGALLEAYPRSTSAARARARMAVPVAP